MCKKLLCSATSKSLNRNAEKLQCVWTFNNKKRLVLSVWQHHTYDHEIIISIYNIYNNNTTGPTATLLECSVVFTSIGHIKLTWLLDFLCLKVLLATLQSYFTFCIYIFICYLRASPSGRRTCLRCQSMSKITVNFKHCYSCNFRSASLKLPSRFNFVCNSFVSYILRISPEIL